MELPPVVLVTPNDADARAGVTFLDDAGIVALACSTLADLCQMSLAAVGCAVLVEEALVQAEVADFLIALSSQPAWSDLPLVLVASEGTSLRALVEHAFQRKRLRVVDDFSGEVVARPVSALELHVFHSDVGHCDAHPPFFIAAFVEVIHQHGPNQHDAQQTQRKLTITTPEKKGQNYGRSGGEPSHACPFRWTIRM